MNILKDVTIPDLDFKGGHLKRNTFKITETSQNIQISDDVANNGI